MTGIKSSTSLNSGQIPCTINFRVTRPGAPEKERKLDSYFLFDRIFIKLTGNEDRNKIPDNNCNHCLWLCCHVMLVFRIFANKKYFCWGPKKAKCCLLSLIKLELSPDFLHKNQWPRRVFSAACMPHVMRMLIISVMLTDTIIKLIKWKNGRLCAFVFFFSSHIPSEVWVKMHYFFAWGVGGGVRGVDVSVELTGLNKFNGLFFRENVGNPPPENQTKKKKLCNNKILICKLENRFSYNLYIKCFHFKN